MEEELEGKNLHSFFEISEEGLSLQEYELFKEKVKECSTQQLHQLRGLLS